MAGFSPARVSARLPDFPWDHLQSAASRAREYPGGIVDLPAPLPVSNVMVVCPVCGKPTRVGTIEKVVKDRTVRVRVCKKCGEEVDRA